MVVSRARSKLFTPGVTPGRFTRAATSDADLVVLDLEDSVPAAAKESARVAVADALRGELFAERRCGVRINDPAGTLWRDDLAAVVGEHLDEVHVPKVNDPAQLATVARVVTNLLADRDADVVLVPTIETARGFQAMQAIAEATPLVGGLQLGVADLVLDVGFHPDETRLGWYRAQVAVTAAAVGVPAWDSVHLDHRDLEGFRAAAQSARRWGMAGKSCIHPDQVPIANEVFRPSDRELAWARRVVAAWEQASADGLAAVSVDGQLVDPPVAQLAHQLLEHA